MLLFKHKLLIITFSCFSPPTSLRLPVATGILASDIVAVRDSFQWCPILAIRSNRIGGSSHKMRYNWPPSNVHWSRRPELLQNNNLVYFSLCERHSQARLNVYIVDAEETCKMEIWMYMAIYAALDYSVGAIRTFKAIRSAQLCETKRKTTQTDFQECTFFGVVLEQRSASHSC